MDGWEGGWGLHSTCRKVTMVTVGLETQPTRTAGKG